MKTTRIELQDVSLDELARQIAYIIIPIIEAKLNLPQENEILTRQEAADFLKKKVSTLHRWDKQNKLRGTHIGEAVYYRKADILALFNKNNIEEINKPKTLDGLGLLSADFDEYLSVRASGILKKYDVYSINDLVKKEKSELTKYKNMGAICVSEIENFLSEIGLKLGMTNEDIIEYMNK